MSDESRASQRAGYLFGVVAYTWWGLVPLYFATVRHVPAVEILAHRIVWSIVLLAGLTALVGGGADLLRVLRSRKLVLTLLLSAVLLAGNWLLYIYATVTGRVTEASLGYYLMPLVNAFLGTVFLGERLRPAHYPALALVAVGMLVPFVFAGTFTWLALVLPVTFGVYGLVRKKAPVDSMTGLSVETLLLLVPSVAFLAVQAVLDGSNPLLPPPAFGPDGRMNGLLLFGGVVTVVPLLTYTLSIRRLPLIAVSFIQFLSPTVQLLLAVLVLGEQPAWYIWVASGCVWVAVFVFLVDAAVLMRRKRDARPVHRVGLGATAKMPAPIRR